MTIKDVEKRIEKLAGKSLFKRTTIKCTVVALILTFVVGCSKTNSVTPTVSGQKQSHSTIASNQNNNTNTSSLSLSPSPVDSNLVVYRNTQYGFSFSLPKSWKGYSIVTDKWDGRDIKSGNVTETGPLYSIRYPQWTSAKPRQDIPIMVFTIAQWKLILQETLAVSAAPIGPSELGRNSNYVFALPARYNFAYPLGYKEVEQILQGKALHPMQVIDPATAMLLNIIQLAKQGKVINIDFPVKTSTIKTIEQEWGQPNKTDIVTFKGTYATFSKYNAVFGFNKTGQIFEGRSFDSHNFVGITLPKVKEVLGNSTSDIKYNGQEVIGYTEGLEFKIEMVFPMSTTNTPNPAMDHYNILYPKGY
jgi:hypothetical protein